MITQTRHLITYLNTASHPESSIISSYVNAIEQLGTQEDVQILLDLFLKQPNYTHSFFLNIIKHKGNKQMADALVHRCFHDDLLLKEDIAEDVLECITWLEHPQAEAILWRHFHYDKADHYMHRSACLGLLHFDLGAHQNTIIQAIEKCIGQGLFQEFVPTLVCKVNDVHKHDELVEQLYESGNTVTSTDCNGGIVLGLALSSGKGETLFRKLFWNERWEIEGGGTGTDNWAYAGLQYLQISMQDLCRQIKTHIDSGQDDQQTIHQLRVLKSMLSKRIYNTQPVLKFSPSFTDSLLNVYTSIFSWSTPHQDDSLAGLASRLTQGKLNFYNERDRLKLKMGQEVLAMK